MCVFFSIHLCETGPEHVPYMVAARLFSTSKLDAAKDRLSQSAVAARRWRQSGNQGLLLWRPFDVQVDEHKRVLSVIRSDLPNQAPIAGEVPFFLGINHLKAIQAAEDTPEVQLLVLSKEKSLELFEEYPEDNTTICANLMATFDLTIEGKKIAGTEDDVADKDKMETKSRIIESVEHRITQRFTALCQAARTGDAEAVATLARQGVNLSQSNYDGRTAMRE
jgi:hypothetical protein